MKKLTTALLFLCIPLFNIAQDCDLPMNSEGEFEIQKVIEQEGIQKSKLYSSALLALNELFGSAKEVIQLQNSEEGVIYANFLSSTRNNFSGRVHDFFFDVKLEFKEDKYRMTVHYKSHFADGAEESSCSCKNAITHPKCGSFACVTNSQWNKQKCKAIEGLEIMLMDLEAQIKTNSTAKVDDW